MLSYAKNQGLSTRNESTLGRPKRKARPRIGGTIGRTGRTLSFLALLRLKPLQYHPAHKLCDLRDYGVSKSSKSVHPSGNPMSHSTHIGFNCPPTTSPRLDLPRSVAESLCINARGVGHIFTASLIVICR